MIINFNKYYGIKIGISEVNFVYSGVREGNINGIKININYHALEEVNNSRLHYPHLILQIKKNLIIYHNLWISALITIKISCFGCAIILINAS